MSGYYAELVKSLASTKKALERNKAEKREDVVILLENDVAYLEAEIKEHAPKEEKS